MLPLPAGWEVSLGVAASVYERHRPERTLLYQLVEDYYPALKAHLAAQGTALPGYVEREFDEYLKCGRLEHGFLRVRCETCHAEHLVAFSCKRRRFCASCGARRMADDCRAGIVPDNPLHSRHPWRSDAGGRAKQEQLPRVRRCWWMRSFPHSRCANGC